MSIAVSPGDVPRQAALAFACVVSSISRVASAGGIGGQLGLGYIAHAPSVAAGYVTRGLTMLLALPSLLLLRRMREQADLIVGRKPGREGRAPARVPSGVVGRHHAPPAGALALTTLHPPVPAGSRAPRG